jgi:hypothetical protein
MGAGAQGKENLLKEKKQYYGMISSEHLSQSRGNTESLF